MLTLEKVVDRDKFWNINQKYLYEMTQFYDDEMDEDGNYHYGYFDSYFCGDPEREALYIRADGQLVGFAMLNRYSHLGEEIDHAMAEFTIFPAFRRRGYASEAVRMIFADRPGRWEIKLNTKNAKAAAFWPGITAAYAPQRTAVSDCEDVLSFDIQG